MVKWTVRGIFPGCFAFCWKSGGLAYFIDNLYYNEPIQKNMLLAG